MTNQLARPTHFLTNVEGINNCLTGLTTDQKVGGSSPSKRTTVRVRTTVLRFRAAIV